MHAIKRTEPAGCLVSAKFRLNGSDNAVSPFEQTEGRWTKVVQGQGKSTLYSVYNHETDELSNQVADAVDKWNRAFSE